MNPKIQEWLRENGYPEHVILGGAIRLIAQWKELAHELEHQQWPEDDLLNTLDARQILFKLSENGLLTESEKHRLTLIDSIILTSTLDSPTPYSGHPKDAVKTTNWWYWRSPKVRR